MKKNTQTAETVSFNGKLHKIFEVITDYGRYKVICTAERYSTFSNLAVQMLTVEDGAVTDLFTTLTVNICPLGGEFACIDTNNNPWAEKFIRENGLGKGTGSNVSSGYCIYPIYQLDTSKFTV